MVTTRKPRCLCGAYRVDGRCLHNCDEHRLQRRRQQQADAKARRAARVAQSARMGE